MADTYTERVRVWVGVFPSRRQYASYFSPPTNKIHGPPSQFEMDQDSLEGSWTWGEFRDEGQTEDLRGFINECPYRDDYCQVEAFVDELCRVYDNSGIGPINTVCMACQNSFPNPKSVQADRYQLHVLGEFTVEVPYDLSDEDDEPCVEIAAEDKSPATARAIAGDGPMNEERFWAMIERVWEEVPDGLALRGRLLKRRNRDWAEVLQFGYCRRVVALLSAALETLNKRDIVKFDRILERRLHELDRPEIHDHTDGSNDGFLYCRGFIVTLGKSYYDLVNTNPRKAIEDVECEEICMCAVRVYVDRYGESPPPSRISRASFSNKAHWK